MQKTVAIVIKKNNKFLLIKRANRPNKNYWAFPGGHVEKSETIYQAAVREAKEEIGTAIINKKSIYNFVHDPMVGHRHRCYVFIGTIAGRIKAGSETKDIGWFSLEQMKGMNLTDYTIHILNHLASTQYSRQT
ncbi:MAG: NUDIX domain-containing protein [Candidatus Aenigmatarchaeota archaeon]